VPPRGLPATSAMVSSSTRVQAQRAAASQAADGHNITATAAGDGGDGAPRRRWKQAQNHSHLCPVTAFAKVTANCALLEVTGLGLMGVIELTIGGARCRP